RKILPIPDNGRNRLHNEIDDCIVWDKCAKSCPVDCNTMQPIRAIAEIGKTPDGTPKRLYAAPLEIHIGKSSCRGLCTTVCPTECLTMTRVFDFSSYDIRDHYYAFAEMSEAEIAAKKAEWEAHQKEKAAAKPAAQGTAKPSEETTPKPSGEARPARPV